MKGFFGFLGCAVMLVGAALGTSAPALAEDAKATLLHSPWLALRIEQDGKMLTLEHAETLRSEVRLKKRPFTIVMPVIGEDDTYQIAAWDDPSIFAAIEDQPRNGNTRALPPYFRGGTGIADTAAGSGLLKLVEGGHHYLTGLRLGPDRDRHVHHVSALLVRDDNDKGFRTVAIKDVSGPLYLVAWFDEDGDDELDFGEYEYLVLRFR